MAKFFGTGRGILGMFVLAFALAALASSSYANTFTRDRDPLHQRYQVPDRDLAVAPYSDNLKVRFFFDAAKISKDCDGILVESPQILVAPAHCLLDQDPVTGKARIDPHTRHALIANRIEAYAGYHGKTRGQTYHPLFFKLGSTDPWHEAARDYAVFRLRSSWPRNTQPMRLDLRVAEAAGALQGVGHSVDNHSKGDVLFLDPYCRTHPETARDYPRWNVVFHDCNFSAVGSGAALFVSAGHDYDLVGMQVAEQADIGYRSQYDVSYAPATCNVAVKARTLWPDVMSLKQIVAGTARK